MNNEVASSEKPETKSNTQSQHSAKTKHKQSATRTPPPSASASELRNIPFTASESRKSVETDVGIASVPNPDIPTRLENITMVLATHDYMEKEQVLQPSYEVQPQDVICGHRGGMDHRGQHTGNERFRVIVNMKVQAYSDATSRSEKTQVIRQVVDIVRQSGGRFIRYEGGKWYDIGNIRAREKAGHAIRSCCTSRTTSSVGGEGSCNGDGGGVVDGGGGGGGGEIRAKDEESFPFILHDDSHDNDVGSWCTDSELAIRRQESEPSVEVVTKYPIPPARDTVDVFHATGTRIDAYPHLLRQEQARALQHERIELEKILEQKRRLQSVLLQNQILAEQSFAYMNRIETMRTGSISSQHDQHNFPHYPNYPSYGVNVSSPILNTSSVRSAAMALDAQQNDSASRWNESTGTDIAGYRDNGAGWGGLPDDESRWLPTRQLHPPNTTNHDAQYHHANNYASSFENRRRSSEFYDIESYNKRPKLDNHDSSFVSQSISFADRDNIGNNGNISFSHEPNIDMYLPEDRILSSSFDTIPEQHFNPRDGGLGDVSSEGKMASPPSHNHDQFTPSNPPSNDPRRRPHRRSLSDH